MHATFTKKKEDFTCEQCGYFVVGTGYTNHCQKCLWSKHVDIDPGDRLATCGGLMKPVGIEGTSPTYTLTHTCIVCGYSKRNVAQVDDDIEALLELARKQANA